MADAQQPSRNANPGSEDQRLKAAIKEAGAQFITTPGERGVLVGGWRIVARKRPILNMGAIERFEKTLGTSHLPEMVFGDSSLQLVHEATGINIHFNALDALHGWKSEALPPVKIPAAAKWKFRSSKDQVVLDYDYTFTTPYCGSEKLEEGLQNQCLVADDKLKMHKHTIEDLRWCECEERIDLVALQVKDPILFYDEIILYEDELADNGVSLLSVKVRVMPTCWFLLLRFWLRVDGVLMRLRDTRAFCSFDKDPRKSPVIIRERCEKEDTFENLALRGLPAIASAYGDPGDADTNLEIKTQSFERLTWRTK